MYLTYVECWNGGLTLFKSCPNKIHVQSVCRQINCLDCSANKSLLSLFQIIATHSWAAQTTNSVNHTRHLVIEQVWPCFQFYCTLTNSVKSYTLHYFITANSSIIGPLSVLWEMLQCVWRWPASADKGSDFLNFTLVLLTYWEIK